MPNTKIAKKQGGAAWQLGGTTPFVSDHDYTAARYALAAHDPASYAAKFDDFLGGTLAVEWQKDVSVSVTIAVTSPTEQNGVIVFTTTATNADKATLALGLHWLVSSGNIYFETRVTNTTAITNRIVEVGVSDALSETLGLAFSSHDITPVAVADDAAVFGYNTTDSMTTWSAVAVKAAGTPQVSVLTAAPVFGTYQRFGIWIDSTGKATYYVDGVIVATFSNAVATTARLTPWVSLVSNTAAAKIIRADYILMLGGR